MFSVKGDRPLVRSAELEVEELGDVIYEGTAAVGSARDAPVWTIKRATFAGNYCQFRYAIGKWTDRTLLIYS